MDRDLSNFVPQNGVDVIGADGEKVGEIDAVERDYFIVRKGLFFPQDHYIPLTAIASYADDGSIYLNVTKDQALEQEWSNPPVSTGTTATTGEAVAYQDTADIDRTTTSGTDDIGYVEEDVIAVHQEELTATTRPVERGQVHIRKDVIEEQQTLEVPVTEEEVEVTRRVVDRPITDADHAFEEGTIEVPLRGEEVEVEKRARVVEEVDIDKTARTHTERVADTVRHEEVHVEGDNIDVESSERRDRNQGAF